MNIAKRGWPLMKQHLRVDFRQAILQFIRLSVDDTLLVLWFRCRFVPSHVTLIAPLPDEVPSPDGSRSRSPRTRRRASTLRKHRRRLGHLDHIFVMELSNGNRYLFAVLMLMKVTAWKDEVFDLPYVEPVRLVIVGLPAIRPSHLYVVRLKDPGGDGDDSAKSV